MSQIYAGVDNRAIGGNSMGGFGALNIAVHHPDIFGSVISLGGYFKAEGRIWGQNAAYMRANSPAFILPKDPKAWKLRIFLGAASKDQPYYTDTKQLSQELKALRMTSTFDLEIGYHAWNIWETQLYHALTWLSWGEDGKLLYPHSFIRPTMGRWDFSYISAGHSVGR